MSESKQYAEAAREIVACSGIGWTEEGKAKVESILRRQFTAPARASKLAQLGARVVEIINNRPPKCVKSPWPEGYPDYALRLVTDAARSLGLLREEAQK